MIAQRLLRGLDRVSLHIGHASAWLALLLVLLTSLIVLLRYTIGVGSIALQEAQLYLHASLFMLAIAYTLRSDEHVRVDIFYRHFSAHRRAVVNLLGTLLFLLPLCAVLLVLCWDYVLVSWQRQEGSADAGGLPFVYLLKTLLLVMPILLALQGLAELLRAVGQWRAAALGNEVANDSESQPWS